MPFFFIDYWYIVLVVPALIFMLITQVKVSSSMKRYSEIRNSRGISGKEMAEMILSSNHVYGVRVEKLNADKGDHYDPSAKVIRLSADVYDGQSITAVGVAAHEAGHALQHDTGYALLKVRNTIIPITNFVSWLPIPLLIISLLLTNKLGGQYAAIGDALFTAAFIILLAGLFVQLITLPVEFNASRRAMAYISEYNALSEDEAKGAKKVLSAAAMTYVASFFVTLMNILRILMIFGRRRD